MTIEGRYNFGNYEFEIPYDVDVKKGLYDTSVILEQTSPGWEKQWKETEILKIKVEEDMQGFHYINSVVETDGNQDAVFRFKNGTGANRIVSIDELGIWVKNVPELENDNHARGYYIPQRSFTCDLDKGTITISKDWIQNYGERLVPYAYRAFISYTLADGEKVVRDLTQLLDSVPIDEFQNPGDEAWYFMYREPESEVLLGDINLDGEVNSGDLAYMLQVTNKRIEEAELSEAQIKAGDVSGADGVINSGDLAKLLQYINGRIDSLG